ncbi:MAG: YccF domain-containing protein [Idiomarina sp.]|nr:YccF domain-containing protein [Idiomarina sp.]MCH8479186.1 YccF domain-containing protein [Wenzhouxiangella sp.]
MRLIGNLLWFILGGLVMGLAWWLVGIIAFLTVVGIPWGRACFVMGNFSFFPFGKEAINRRDLTTRSDIGTSGFGTVGNVVWFILAGVWLAIGHVISALACFITIIGIPFGIQHLKLADIALFPIGKTIVSKEVARAAREANAHAEVAAMRRR